MATTVTLTPVTNLDYTTWAAVKTYLDISGTCFVGATAVPNAVCRPTCALLKFVDAIIHLVETITGPPSHRIAHGRSASTRSRRTASGRRSAA